MLTWFLEEYFVSYFIIMVYYYEPFPFGVAVQLPPPVCHKVYGEWHACLFQTQIFLVLLSRGYEKRCVLHMQKRKRMVTLDLFHPIL
jgi:hypothetical protein